MEAAKQNIPRLYETSLKLTFQRKECLGKMKPLPRPQQKSQSVNPSPLTQIPRYSASVAGKGGRSSSNDGTPL